MFDFLVDLVSKSVKFIYKNNLEVVLMHLSVSLIFIIAFTLSLVSIIKHKNIKIDFLRKVNGIFLFINLLYSLNEFFLLNNTFKTEISVTVFVIISYLVSDFIIILTNKICGRKIKNLSTEKKNANVDFSQEKSTETPVKELSNAQKIIDKLACKDYEKQTFIGYINVSYLRELINKLKQNELEETDAKKVEDLEVYLLNFVNRQPNDLERIKLNALVGDLYKQLAKYNAI